MQHTSFASSTNKRSPRVASTGHRSEKRPMARATITKWTDEEYNRYLSALALYPNGSWKIVAGIVGTRTVRQVMSHAQKIAQKQKRHIRGLKPAGRPRRITPVSPISVEDVATANRLAQRNGSYDPFLQKPWELEDIDILSDEEYVDRLQALAHADAGLFEMKAKPHVPAVSRYEDAYNRYPQWSEEDTDWFMELERCMGWADELMVSV